MNLINIFKYLKGRGISGYKISKDLNISQQLISYHCKKKDDPTLDLIDEIASHYKINPKTLLSQLYNDVPEPAPKPKVKKRVGNVYTNES